MAVNFKVFPAGPNTMNMNQLGSVMPGQGNEHCRANHQKEGGDVRAESLTEV